MRRPVNSLDEVIKNSVDTRARDLKTFRQLASRNDADLPFIFDVTNKGSTLLRPSVMFSRSECRPGQRRRVLEGAYVRAGKIMAIFGRNP